mgnify:CR=1 FL=1
MATKLLLTHTQAWLSIMATVFLMGPFLWLVHRSSKYYEYYGLSDGKGLFKLGNCVWYCFGAIVQQGGDYLPLAISGRILITFWWLFVIVTVTTYSGNLVALLTFPKIFNPINDLNDLIAFKSLLKYGATRTSGIEELIKDSADKRMQMLGDNLFYYDSVDSESLFEEVKKMKMVFLATETEIKYLIAGKIIFKCIMKKLQLFILNRGLQTIQRLPVDDSQRAYSHKVSFVCGGQRQTAALQSKTRLRVSINFLNIFKLQIITRIFFIQNRKNG